MGANIADEGSEQIARITFSLAKDTTKKGISLSLAALQAIWKSLKGGDTRTDYFPPGATSLENLTKMTNGQERCVEHLNLSDERMITSILRKNKLCFSIGKFRDSNEMTLYFAPRQQAAIIAAVEKEIRAIGVSPDIKSLEQAIAEKHCGNDKVITSDVAKELTSLKDLLIEMKGLPVGEVTVDDLAKSEHGNQATVSLGNIAGEDRAELNALFKDLNATWACGKDEKSGEYTLFFKKNQGDSIESALKKVMNKYVGTEEKKRATEEDLSKGMSKVVSFKDYVNKEKQREKSDRVKEKNKGKDNRGGR